MTFDSHNAPSSPGLGAVSTATGKPPWRAALACAGTAAGGGLALEWGGWPGVGVLVAFCAAAAFLIARRSSAPAALKPEQSSLQAPAAQAGQLSQQVVDCAASGQA